MSFHYTVCVSTHLRSDLPAIDLALADYLFNAAPERPVLDDDLRAGALALEWLRQNRQRDSDPGSASLLQVSRRPTGEVIDAQLLLFAPGNPVEGIFEEWLSLLRWLASLVAVDGHFATVVCEDGGDAPPFLFYACERALFLKSEKEVGVVISVDSGARRELSTT